MDQSKLKRTWSLKDVSRLLKIYRWLYNSDPGSFCKFFWGILLSPFGALFIVVLKGLSSLKPPEEKAVSEPADRAVKRHDKANKVLEALIRFVDRASARGQKIADFFTRHPLIGYVVWRVLVVVVGIAVAGSIAFGLYSWITIDPRGLVAVLEGLGIFIGGVAALIGIGWLIAKFIEHHMTRTEAVLNWVTDRFIDFGHGFRAVYRFFRLGYYAVKTRTCPRIEIIPTGAPK